MKKKKTNEAFCIVKTDVENDLILVYDPISQVYLDQQNNEINDSTAKCFLSV